MSPYNFTNYTMPSDAGVDSFGDLFVWANDAVSGGLGIAILVMTFLFGYLGLNLAGGQNKTSLAGCLFITTIVAILLRSVDLIQRDYIIGILILLTVICMIWLFKSEN